MLERPYEVCEKTIYQMDQIINCYVKTINTHLNARIIFHNVHPVFPVRKFDKYKIKS